MMQLASQAGRLAVGTAKRTASSFLRFIVGMLGTFLLASIFGTFQVLAQGEDFISSVSGGVSAVLGVFLLSVICTAGVTLVVYIPLFYLVGTAILRLFGFAMLHHPKATKNIAGLDKDIQALVIYIRQARDAGMPATAIADTLRKNGWAEIVMDQAFNAA